MSSSPWDSFSDEFEKIAEATHGADLEKVANPIQPGNPFMHAALAGMTAGGLIGGYTGWNKPLVQDDLGNIYQPTLTDKLRETGKGLYRGTIAGGLLGLGADIVVRGAMNKLGELKTPLKAHQQRVVDRISQDDQPGLVVAHGLGSGKTLTSIAAQDALGETADIIAPAALLGNYRKERAKHLKGKVPAAHLTSMQNMATKELAPKSPLLIVDEAHRARDPATATFQALKKNEAQKRLLLTGSPFYNHPADIAPLIDLAANAKVLPYDRDEFTRRYIAEKTVQPPVWDRVANHFRKEENRVKPGTVPILYDKRAPELKAAFEKWVDYHPGSTEGFPTVDRQTINIPMSDEQLKVYDTLMDQAPAWVAAKVKKGLPPNKREAAQLNSFLTAARQVSNTTSPFVQGAPASDPKLQTAFEHLQKTLKENPRARAVVYSNWLDAGINPYKQKLEAAGIPYGEFTGEMPSKKRDQLVKDYNAGKLRTLLLSSAGGEGLDLKGTRLMQILDPHWNKEKLKQVEGRGARYLSHADLPPEERKLLIENYLATRPPSRLRSAIHRVMGQQPDKSVDEYLNQMSNDKEALVDQFRALLPNSAKTKTAADKSDKKDKKVHTTEASQELAKSLKPRLAAFGAYTLPMAVSGAQLGSYFGLEGAAALGTGGLVLGHLLANQFSKDIVRDGKTLARQALRTASKENTLREQAGKIDWGEVNRSAALRMTMSLPALKGLLGPLAIAHASEILSKRKPDWVTPEMAAAAKAELKKPSVQLSMGLSGAALASEAVGAIATGYLDKYRRAIAVNELDNVQKDMDAKDAEKLKRLRKQVEKLEVKVEGDGWNAPEKAEKPSKGRHDW